MKNIKQAVLGTVVGLAMIALSAHAEDRVKKPEIGANGGQVVRPERPERPERPDRPQLPPEIRRLLAVFEKARDTYLEKQKELLKQLKDATEEQKAALREQLKENQDKFAKIRAELRERLKELRDQLPKHRDAIDAAKEKIDGRPRKGE